MSQSEAVEPPKGDFYAKNFNVVHKCDKENVRLLINFDAFGRSKAFGRLA